MAVVRPVINQYHLEGVISAILRAAALAEMIRRKTEKLNVFIATW
jgi:hypothetical protein